MQVNITRPDGSELSVFGICDFESTGDSVIVWPFSDSKFPGKREYGKTELIGEATSAVDESGYNAEGIYETIGGLATDENVGVVVAETEHYPDTAKAVSRLRAEEDFEGEILTIKQTNREAHE